MLARARSTPGGHGRVMTHANGGDVDRLTAAIGGTAVPRLRLPRPRMPGTPRTPRQDTSLLGRIETAFLSLPVAYPHLHVDGAAIGCGLPAAPVTPDEARRVLTNDGTPYAEKDRGWAYLVNQARTAGPDWQIVALGTALPGLKHRIRQRGIRRDADVDAEIVCQFLTHLGHLNLTRPNICGRLVDSAVQRYLRLARRPAPPVIEQPLPDLPATPDNGLDQTLRVLADLAATGRLRRDDARLIAYTRLVGLTIPEAAARLGIGESAATMRRTRAEAKIRNLLRGQRSSPCAATEPSGPPAPRTPAPSTRQPATIRQR